MKIEPVRKSKWGRVGKVALFVGTVLLCLAGIAYSRTDLSAAAGSYDKNRDAAKEMGLCITGQEAAKLYEVQAEGNGAHLLEDLIKAIEPHSSLRLTLSKYNEVQVLDAWRDINPHIPTLKIALAKRHLIFQRTFPRPIDSNRGLRPLFELVRLMVFRADIAAKKNDCKLAGDLLRLAANLSIHLADEPCLNALELRASAAMVIEAEIKRLIPQQIHDLIWQNVFAETLAALDHPYEVRRVLQVEHWTWLWAGQILLGDTTVGTLKDMGWKKEERKPDITLAGGFIPRFRAANLSRFHQYYVEVIGNLPKDPHDFVGITNSMTKAYSAIDYSDTALSYSYLRHSIMSFVGLPCCIHLVDSIGDETTQRNVLFQALSISRERAADHKGLPLTGRYVQDFGGRTLGFDQTRDEWIVYSVGRNGMDEHTKRYSDDFIVRLPK